MNAQEGMEAGVDDSIRAEAVKGDTIVGNDVWIGYQAVILPGVRIGNGSIIASKAVASRTCRPMPLLREIPRVVKMRFDEPLIELLQAITWWDWPVDKTTRNLDAIRGADIERLENAE